MTKNERGVISSIPRLSYQRYLARYFFGAKAFTKIDPLLLYVYVQRTGGQEKRMTRLVFFSDVSSL